MDNIEMAKAYSSGFDPQYREVAYDAFLCGYDAKCDVPSSKKPVCLYDGEAPSKQKCGDCTIACSVRVEEEPDKNLEEAAEEYRRESYRRNVLPNIDGPTSEYGGSIKDAFIAGAQWQKEQYHFFNKAWAENMQTELDRNYENGKQAMKDKMKAEAVEGEAHPDDCEIWVNLVGYGYKFNEGDKVRIIVLPKEDEK